MFKIKSNTSSQELIFSNCRGEWFTAELRGNPSASIIVSTYTDRYGLVKLFNELADLDTPWQGKIGWSSLEEEFKITAACSILGHVTFVIEMNDFPGGENEWSLSAAISTDLGMLPQLEKEAKEFFEKSC